MHEYTYLHNTILEESLNTIYYINRNLTQQFNFHKKLKLCKCFVFEIQKVINFSKTHKFIFFFKTYWYICTMHKTIIRKENSNFTENYI